MIVGIVSGYFNPIHRGHIEYINAAKSQCEKLVVIVNSDEQVQLKGSVPFMDQDHRKFVIDNLRAVDDSIIAIDKDKTVAETIRFLFWDYPNCKLRFFNSGDRVKNAESKEVQTCEYLGVEYITLPLPKVCSSSELIKKAANEV